MLKKILFVLDGSKAGHAARAAAFDLSKKTKAALTAVGVLDTPWITAAQPEPIGGASFKLQRDEAMIQHTHAHMKALLQDFEKDAAKHHLISQVVEVEGFPATEIERLSHEHDLIVIGKTTDFHFDLDHDSDITVRHIARDNPRPLYIVPEDPVTGNKVLVALDGSLQASRALHMFLLLQLAGGQPVEILSINEDRERAENVANRGVRLCQSHGVEATAHTVTQSGNRAQTIITTAQEHKASLMVMGGFSHSILREVLFGSCTKTLMANSRIPLFLHH